jgi:hypothetical protein
MVSAERVEVIFGIAFTVSAAASFGAADISFLGQDLLTVLTEIGPFTLDYATVVSLAAILVGYYEFGGGVTSVSSMEQFEQAAAAGTVVLTAYGAANPAFVEGESALIQLGLVGVSLAGYWALARN